MPEQNPNPPRRLGLGLFGLRPSTSTASPAARAAIRHSMQERADRDENPEHALRVREIAETIGGSSQPAFPDVVARVSPHASLADFLNAQQAQLEDNNEDDSPAPAA